jgi:hypothetical protein
MVAFLSWNALAIFITRVHVQGFGSVNPIDVYMDMGDPGDEWLIGLGYYFHGIGLIMLFYTIYTIFISAKSTVQDVEEGVRSGRQYDMFERYRNG